MSLQGKTAIVTGAGRGIGKAVAIKLAQEGANVVVNYSSSSTYAEKTAEEIKSFGGNAVICKGDVRSMEDVEQMVKTAVDHFGPVDILVNNAGITKDTPIVKMSEKDWDDVLDINLKGAFNCTKAVAKMMMKRRSGKIINITSVVGVMGNKGQANYAASKAGMIGLTKSTAKELASRNITCNAIAPGFIQSDMTDQLSDAVREEYLKSIPLKRLGTPEEVAAIIAFLVSDAANYVTGQVLHIDGGLVM
ncbi:3-oxoacyl-[acyl-carrier-protein] reductase [Petroclostridium sp. X23]|uniref:3-oxoacyl-[acyl-carrier-protein] reductase n=1 Tax=Petroclostridium sp. X23 TaxID=3045146 RepID=UPI0024AE3C73|nr:3-oxoacyl-[acyl-carrier-protein] reductase [Petroclostridium sp. X23]WHH59413.1 3-oxoacyl-[acyl-carrier-protein] reductase [Petroclostridium sp. X23]